MCDPASYIGCCSLCDKIPNLQYLHLIHLRGDGGINSKQYVGSNFLNFLLWWAELIGLETWLSSPLLDNPCFMALWKWRNLPLVELITLKVVVFLSSNHLQHPLCTEYGLNELFSAISSNQYYAKALFCVLSSKNIAVGFFVQAVELNTECQQFLKTNMAFCF